MPQQQTASLADLLHFQESLRSVAAAQPTLRQLATEALRLYLNALGSENGRLTLNLTEAGPDLSVTIANGQPIDGSPTANPRSDLAGDTVNKKEGSSTRINAPLVEGQHTLGELTVTRPNQVPFGPDDRLRAQLMAGYIAATLTAAQAAFQLRAVTAEQQQLTRWSQELTAVLVHDLQGPLGNVITGLEMIEEQLDDPEATALLATLDITMRSSFHLRDLVTSLMDIGRLEAGNTIGDRENVSVAQLFNYVVEVDGPELDLRDVTVVQQIAANFPLLRINQSMIQRVLLNLVDNALNVSSSGQMITLRGTYDGTANLAKICVDDEGPGVPKEHRGRVFEKYQRLNEASSPDGLGLGLAFCKLAVEAHGGRIWVEDSQRQGACFCFTVPISEQT